MNSYDLIPDGVPLSRVPGLTESQIRSLKDCWILTAQELVALHNTNEATRIRLAATLGLARPALDPLIAAANALIPLTRDARGADLELAASQTQFGLGALLDEPPEVLEESLKLPPYEPPTARAALPESYSLLDQLPPVRNQGSRGTCVAHAVLSAREQLEVAASGPRELNLSEQYVYWWCKEHDGIPKVSGTYVRMGMRCLAEAGSPLESAWPYISFEKGDQGQGPPPDAAKNGDAAFRTFKTQEFSRTDINGIKNCLSEDRVVAFSIPVFDSWYASLATQRWGKITLPLPGEPQNGGHAMALVGYQDDPDAPGGGYFLVRNSWQPWSWDGAWQEGYGHIPYAYISRHATAVFAAERITGAEVYVRDSTSDAGVRPLAQVTWNSPDIWLRRTADGGEEHQPPMAGRPNALYVRTWNRGPAYAYEIRVEVLAAPAAPHIRPASWKSIGQLQAPWLAPGATVLGPLTWTPPTAGPYAFRVRISTVDQAPAMDAEPKFDAGVAQRNQWRIAVAPGGKAEVSFDVAGVTGKSGAISLLVDRGNLPSDAIVSPLRLGPAQHGREASDVGSRGFVEDAVIGALTGGFLLGAGQVRRAGLSLTLPPLAASGTRYAMAITQSQGKDVVGRLTVQIEVT